MKAIYVIVAFMALVSISTSVAMPNTDWSTDSHILKIGFISSSSMLGIAAYHNPGPGGLWEVWIGVSEPSWTGSKLLGMKVFLSDSNGFVTILY